MPYLTESDICNFGVFIVLLISVSFKSIVNQHCTAIRALVNQAFLLNVPFNFFLSKMKLIHCRHRNTCLHVENKLSI